MDAASLRWVLAIIGVIVIVGVYLFSLHQNRLRRRAAIKTYTQEELESSVIEDETLRAELSSINTMLGEGLKDKDLHDIKINPALDNWTKKPNKKKKNNHLPDKVYELTPEHRVVHVLKFEDDRLMTGAELKSSFSHVGLEWNDPGFFTLAGYQFQLLNMSRKGLFDEIDDPQFHTCGIVCFCNKSSCGEVGKCYEMMLKKIDELVRILNLKVYNEEFHLLTLHHVTKIRDRLAGKSG